MGRQNKPTVVNELTVGNNKLTCPEDIAEGFNEYFSNIGLDLSSRIDSSNYNFETYIKNAKSEFAAFQPVSMGFLAIKPLALIKFLAKLSNLKHQLSQTH